MKPEYKNLSVSDMERAAKRAGLNVTNKSKHMAFENPRTGECMMYPNRPMGLGLHCKIIKWLLKAGVVFVLVATIINMVV